MSHDPISVILTASGRPGDFRACLETLRPSLGLRDEVVCVVPTDRPDLTEVLSTRRWLTSLPDDSGDQAARWRAGLAVTSHAVVVLLDGDVMLPAHWLDAVAGAFADADVVAAGPRCYHSFGPQGLDVPEDATSSIAGFKAYARQWRERQRGRVSVVPLLGPVCVAVRRDALARAGGPGVELPYVELRAEGRFALVESALLAHAGTDECVLLARSTHPRPLLSACLIAKDEEDVLAECLTSVRDFVDEIVVYDTGSSDRTREIAAEQGARVITGYWDDHFGDARNRALAHCGGEWVLQIDADEVALGQPTRLRDQLRSAEGDAFHVALESQQGHGGAGATLSMLYPRLFRRDRGRYVHRLHEQVADRVTGKFLGGAQIDALRILHSGYTQQRLAIKQKLARNLRLARLSAEDGDSNVPVLTSVGRAEFATGRYEAAVEVLRRAVDTNGGTRPVRLLALKTLIESLLKLGRFEEARASLDELRRVSTKSVTVSQVEAAVCFDERDFEGALAIAQAFPESATDDIGTGVGRANLAEVEIKSLFYLGRTAEAAQRLRERLEAGDLPLSIVETSDLLNADGAGLSQLAALVPRSSLRGLLFSANDGPVAMTDEVLEALWHRYGGEPVILAFAAEVGGRLPVIRALEWSVRLRETGLNDRCTLLALAANDGRTPRDRSIAAAVALEMFADQHATGLLAEALAAVPYEDGAAVLDEMRLLAPGVAATVEVDALEEV